MGSEHLRTAIDILERFPFCTKTFAIDKNGVSVDPNSEDAVAFDGLGALMAAYNVCSIRVNGNGPEYEQDELLIESFASEQYGRAATITDVSDQHGKKAVLSIFYDALDWAMMQEM